ncbi:MAG: helix-turn-helix domain-containing protein [Peptostreptococcaceae bacterium]|nr:helix-turn-helix domain-containing protein [Peptostreptococcaceae bacterium]
MSLAAARVNAGFTQKEVAKALNVGNQTVISWEKGESEPRVNQAIVLCELYNLPIDNIFFGLKSH